MSEIRNVKLELLRAGPAHNQLLSPLTSYLALCGADGPVEVHIPFQHAQLQTRLDRLRYVVDGHEIAPSQREAEVREIGELLGRVLSQVPGLLSEISGARRDGSEVVHLRLSVGANELSLVPFEFAIGSDGFPGSGAPLFLQSIAPITLTREVRHGRQLPVYWDRRPRILFAFASPGTLPVVPAQAHLESLRRAVAPWIRWESADATRLAEIKNHITVLPNASLQQIRRACVAEEYTHVHILAHGDQKAGRYGLYLGKDGDAATPDFVDGEALSTALTARDAMGPSRFRPTVVSLATCDSGNAGSVVTAGGSLAHALHAHSIPWVFASQFPLWMRSSSIAADVLYSGLLRGDDPRWVLYRLRQRLRTDSTATHDWASIVAYATVPWDFDEQVEAFRNRQTRQEIELLFDQAERLAGGTTATDGPPSDGNQTTPTGAVRGGQAALGDQAGLEAVYASIRERLTRWLSALPANTPSRERAQRLGMAAASEKRIGTLLAPTDPQRATSAYERACELYRTAIDADLGSHWVITQYLSMKAVLAPTEQLDDLARELGSWWSATRQMAQWELRTATRENRAWAFATLAELELLGAVYAGALFDATTARAEIVRMCQELGNAVDHDAFPIHSTRRQFERYVNLWKRDAWKALAGAAIEMLPKGSSWTGRAYLGPGGG